MRGESPSISMNNKTPATYMEPLNVVAPSHFAENMADSNDTPSEKDKVVLIDHLAFEKAKNRKVIMYSKVGGKRKQAASASSGRETHHKTHKYPELLLEDNKLDKKSFKDVIPQHVQEDPLYILIAIYPVNVRTFPDPIMYLAGLKTSWEHSPKEPIIYYRRKERISIMRGGESPSVSMNNETPPTYMEPLNVVAPSQFAKNMDDSNDTPSEKDEVVLIDRSAQASKAAGEPSDPLDVDSDPDIHEKEKEKDKAYAEFEAKCNDALQDLDKNPLVLYLRAEIKILHEQASKLHDEYSSLVLEEKKWVNYDQTLAIL
ncbi:hypothetical protein Tco_1398429, partial [Tanacetum coccineum]